MILCFYGRDKAYPEEDRSYPSSLSILPSGVTSIETWQSRVLWERTISLQVVLEKPGKRLQLLPLLGLILSAESYLAQGHSLFENDPQSTSDQEQGLIISLYSVKNPRLFWEWGYQCHHHKFHLQYSALGGADNRAGHCRAMSTVKPLLMSDGSI